MEEGGEVERVKVDLANFMRQLTDEMQVRADQKELELKTALIREIDESTASYFGAIELVALTGKETSLAKFDRAYVTWRASYDVVSSELEAYFPGKVALVREWNRFGSGMIAMYFLFSNETPKARRATLVTYREYLRVSPDSLPTIVSTPLLEARSKIGAYDDELARLFDGFRFKKEDLIQKILRTHLPL